MCLFKAPKELKTLKKEYDILAEALTRCAAQKITLMNEKSQLQFDLITEHGHVSILETDRKELQARYETLNAKYKDYQSYCAGSLIAIDKVQKSLTNPTQEELITNLTSMLRPTLPSADLWFQLDTILVDWGKAQDVIVKPLNIGAVYTKLAAICAGVELTDANYQGCSLSDFARILKGDFARYIRYVRDYYDCENYTHYLMARLGFIYKLNNLFYVESEQGIEAHAWGIFADVDTNNLFGVEPQNGAIWELEAVHSYPYDPKLIRKIGTKVIKDDIQI